jgi:hypothetical protein
MKNQYHAGDLVHQTLDALHAAQLPSARHLDGVAARSNYSKCGEIV